MRIACLGGGPAGFYFAISMKLRMPDAEIDVFERNKDGDTFGWGIVFSDQTLGNLEANDPVSAKTIADSFAHWDDIEVRIGEKSMVSTGHGFIGIGRRHMLQILQARAAELGIKSHFETEFTDDLSQFADYDLIVAADGVNSVIRERYQDKFDVDIQHRRNKFIWLGTTKHLDAFGFYFEHTPGGWMWCHAYQFDETHSTFIVECSPETWEANGFDKMSQDESIAACERIFARHLDGHPLISNSKHLRGSAAWIHFRRVLCGSWSFDNVVLLGDAAHTAHFSIGSGTKLGFEDAIKLAEVLGRNGSMDPVALRAALAEYQEERHLEALKIQNSARNSTDWFERLDRYLGLELPQFVYSLMTRSQRVSHENLRLRDPKWLGEIEKWFWERAGGNAADQNQPIFAPFKLRDVTLGNRIAVAPVLTYAADNAGRLNDFHSVHYGARALGGAGLVISETLAVAPEGRMTDACPGLYNDDQAGDWTWINAFVHAHSGAKTCAQLGHAGARAACQPPKDPNGFDIPLAAPWAIVSASAKPWKAGGLVPAELTEGQMGEIKDAFVAAARRADAAGFDMLEIMAGHGMLLSSFITPVMNARTDGFGGSLDNRLRFPLAVVEAVRAAWPSGKPLAVRISANDWVGDQGITPECAVKIASKLKAAGVDIVDVSSGETDPAAQPVYGRMFQAPFADQIRNEVGIATIAVGNITDADQANSILASGRADIVALGRPHMVDPAWTLHAAASARYSALQLPVTYQLGLQQATNVAARSEKIQA